MTARIDTLFAVLGFSYFVLGIALGIGMGISQDFRLMHVHAHINLVGFVAQGAFGFAYRLWPSLRTSALAVAQFWLMVVGTPIFLAGLPLAQFHDQPALAIIGSLMVLTSAALFLTMFAGKALNEVRA